MKSKFKKLIYILLTTSILLLSNTSQVNAMFPFFSSVMNWFTSPTAEQAQRNDSPTAPDGDSHHNDSRPKKRQKTHHDADANPEIKLLNTKNPEIKIIPSMQQEDGWRCGYFSSFNCYKLVRIINKRISPENITSVLNGLDLNNDGFDSRFTKSLDRVFSANPKFRDFYSSKTLFNTNDIENFLTTLFRVESFENLHNISIIESVNFDSNKLYPDFYILKNIQSFREQNIPQLIILHQADHWTTWIITKEGIWGTNSIDGYNPSVNQTIMQIFNYFNYQILPKYDQIQPIIRQLKRIKSVEELEAIKQLAFQHGFTPKQFQFMTQKYTQTLKV